MRFFCGKRAVLVLLAVAAVMMLPLAAQATLYGFYQITNNGSQATASQYWVDVTASGDQVNFHFTNSSVVASSICDIYFADGTLLGIASVINSSGVDFSQGATPANLPGGGSISPPFATTEGFSADSNEPPVANGVNAAAEFVDILFNLKSGKSFADVITDLNSGALRIGLHVQAIGPPGQSESFVNNPVPIPPSALLLGSGLLGLGLIGWRRREKKA